MTEERFPTRVNVIVDLQSSSFNFKSLYKYVSNDPPPSLEHHYWHYGGLRSFAIDFESNRDQSEIDAMIQKLKSIQNHCGLFPPFWISKKKMIPSAVQSSSISGEVINSNVKFARFNTNSQFFIEYTAGALTQLDTYMYDVETEIKDTWSVTFYQEKIEIAFGPKTERRMKSIKANLLDRCVVIMREAKSLTLFINMVGNPIDFILNESMENESRTRSNRQHGSFNRTAPREAQPFYSTVRLVFSFTNDEEKKNLHSCYEQFLQFFERNGINSCFGILKSASSPRNVSPEITQMIQAKPTSFIKQYCWQMLLSIGYRIQHRLKKPFINHMKSIQDDDDFYKAVLHIWRRSTEYHFINLSEELMRYREKLNHLFPPANPFGDAKHDDNEHQRWSIYRAPDHYAYVPSVTITPTTICINPLRLVKTNRVLREEKFGGNMMFALVEVKEENRKTDIFPRDYRDLRWKMEILLEEGFDLGYPNRVYRYLHHSQSQLKDKQFWFYHHDPQENFSFEEAYTWMGDFQSEKVVAKHSARIALCFTSAEATIRISSNEVELIDDVHSEDSRYIFTDGVGAMSRAIRDKINPHREFSAIQIRYGGCKGVISVNPELDNTPHQLRIRKSMEKFKSSHDILELCRISKPRPLYLNRQIIVLLANRQIDDRQFLLLQNDHQKFLSESLVLSERGFELLNDRLNRSLFPLRKLIKEAQLTLIDEPFFRQLIINFGKLDLMQMKQRTRLKLPKNSARNMIGIVDEYGILEYGQVFIQYTPLDSDYSNDSDNMIILNQKVVVTKNPCHHPGDIRVFQAIDVPKLRHLKDVIVFPQRGERPHPNEISGSDLDGDEYAVIWHPDFIPETPNDTPYDYNKEVPTLAITDRPVNRADIQATVLDISEQSCVGKLCSLHLAYTDLYGIAHPEALAIAGYISEELDSAKTGRHPLTPKEIHELESRLNNERPDYFDKPNYKLYPSVHVLGQLFRSCQRFDKNWAVVHTPPSTVIPYPIDPLLIHDSHERYRSSVIELARIYREAIMEILYVYRFSSDVDLLCRFDSSSPQQNAPMSRQQLESACIIADSAQVEYKQLIRRIHYSFNQGLDSDETLQSPDDYHSVENKNDRAMAKASALYIHCYTDTTYARRILSLPWLFAKLLIDVRKLNIKKQSKLLSPALVTKMLEIQPYRFVGQSLQMAARYLVEQKKSFFFHHVYSTDVKDTIEISLRPTSTAKCLVRKQRIPLIKYWLIEILHEFFQLRLSDTPSSITENEPALVNSVWQHILTRYILETCSPLILVPAKNSSSTLLNYDWSSWSDEQAWHGLQTLIELSRKCSDHQSHPMKFAQANEYLVSALQKMATTGSLFPVEN